MALTVAKMTTKVGMTGGAIYWTVQQGVWGTPHEGAEAMKRLQATIQPDEEQKATIKHVVAKANEGFVRATWNQGTRTVFEGLRDVPEYTVKATQAVSGFVSDSFKN